MSAWKTDCRLFTGFSPCRYRRPTCDGCPHYRPVGERVLVIALDALGDVLRTTALLPALRRTHRDAHVTWLTREEAAPLLLHNPLIDRVLVLGDATLPTLQALEFDLVLCPEKSIPAGALARAARAPVKRGFGVDAAGAIVPLNPEADELYRLGLDNERKFFLNEKSAQRLVTEALGLPYRHDRYVLVLDDAERRAARADRMAAGAGDDEVLIGWNTGCGPRYPYKRFDIGDQIASMVSTWRRLAHPERTRFALLGGGKTDARRNREIAQHLRREGIEALETPTTSGVRRGAASVAACDVVVTGDTLALHLAIALKKPVVAWFGVTCHQEIDVYGRGIKVLADVPCRPCWLQACDLEPKCFRTLPWEAFAASIAEMADAVLEEGAFIGERLVGTLLRPDRVPPPLGVSPGPVLEAT